MRPHLLVSVLASCLLSSSTVLAEVTVYGFAGPTTIQLGGTTTTTAVPTTSFVTANGPPPQFTGAAAYNQVYLAPPAVPDTAPANAFSVDVALEAADVPGLSIMLNGTFFGFSIEMSVVNQLIGSSPVVLQPIFLNFMSLIAERAGAVHVRVGGNTQETAYMVDSLPNGKFLLKDKNDANNPTYTPTIAITPDLIYMLGNASSFLPLKWYLGIPFNDTNWRFNIAEVAEAVLGDSLLGFQASNEPDFYVKHNHRPEGWGPTDFFKEFGTMTEAWNADMLVPVKNNLIAPSVSGGWTLQDVWDTGFFDAYADVLSMVSVEHYPNDNCAAMYPQYGYEPKDPLAELPKYLSHKAATNLLAPYVAPSALCQQYGKPLIMFETNTASCGGFPGISDAFVASLWGIDYAMQLAFGNFSSMLFHFGGQDVAYNPFTASPTNVSAFRDWTVGPIFYSAIAVTEALGKTGTAQVVDLSSDIDGDTAAVYAVYEQGKLARAVLINYLTDPSGAHDYTATFAMDGDVPASVTVKYLVAPSVAEKDNITWAGQTLGGRYNADGRWHGDLDIHAVQCDVETSSCKIKVPAPGDCWIFAPATFSTSVVTKTLNTLTVDPAVLATSNGESGKSRRLHHGKTSSGVDINRATKPGAPGSRDYSLCSLRRRSFLVSCGDLLVLGRGLMGLI
ncbi:glycoside hydrolase family 79 protein [Epithele typhae]|uniref:glycoside hydrolase family 79 protein n=1 Tax=Epithele typhae TaxID=378194 RepID=UPI002008BA3D|nr:glycoside hydrolase family 79 protein [Epithele typhae]KAH9943353.1 glycoside hydrolase family 79 protein [Epithele typhae]